MPDISIKQAIKTMDTFKDKSWYYREFGKYIFQGYVPFQKVTGWGINELERFANFNEFQRKGNLWSRKSINLPYAITNYITRSMYAESPVIDVGKNNTETLTKILEDNKFFFREKKLQATKLNIGDYVLKPYIKDGELKIDYITGDMFIATKIDNNEVIEGIFITEKEVMEKNKKYIYRRLEWHLELYSEKTDTEEVTLLGRQIVYELYKTRKYSELGVICGIDKFARIFGENVGNGHEEFRGWYEPTFILGLNPDENNKDWYSGRGLGIHMNTLDSIISADEAFHAKSTDNVYGSMQKLTPEKAMEMQGYVDASGSLRYSKHINPNDPDIFIYAGEDVNGNMPIAYAPTLRTEQHIASMNADIDLTSTNEGITAGTFRFDGKSIITATQVINEKSDTAKTIKEIERNTSEDWKRLFLLIQYFVNTFGNDKLNFTYKDITIEWKDNIIADDETEREFDWRLVEAGAWPLYKFTAKYKGIEEKEAIKLQAERQAEINSEYKFDNLDEE